MSNQYEKHNPRDIAKALSQHYDSLVPQYVETFFHDLTDKPWLDRFLTELPRGSHILDVGCGPGNFSRYMCDQGFAVTGVDISNEMLRAAKTLVPNAQFHVADMTQLSFTPNSFDGILVAYSFLHVPGYQAHETLVGFRRVLTTDGIICLFVKEGSGQHDVSSPLIAGETCYVQLWSPTDLRGLLGEVGFEVIHEARDEPRSPQELPYDKLLFLARVV